MVNQSTAYNVDTNVSGTQKMSIAANANIFSILSSRIYERPIEAIVREVFSNAIDANIEAGKTSGLKMHLPTVEEQYFQVVDSGAGMDNEKLVKVFFTYGESTKANDNGQIGGFGIGAKSPYAYADQFTIESKKNGIKTTYIAMKDETDSPCHSDPFFEDCGDETGTTITVPVEENDIRDFYKAAVKVLMFSKEFPELNKESHDRFIRVYNDVSNNNNSISTIDDFVKLREANMSGNHIEGLSLYGAYIEMGGVIYSVDESVIPRTCSRLVKGIDNILVHMPIGSVAPQASREKLYISKETSSALKSEFLKIINGFVDEIGKIVNNASLSLKEKTIALDKYSYDQIDSAIYYLTKE